MQNLRKENMFTVKTDFSDKHGYSVATLLVDHSGETKKYKVKVKNSITWGWVDVVDYFENLRELLEGSSGEQELKEDCMCLLVKWCKNEDVRYIALELIQAMVDYYL